jgi:hypothetical protein
VNPIVATFDYVWERFSTRLDGLDDDEYFWEPVAGCWSLRPTGAGEWALDGGGGGGPAPSPAPITTIAWRIGHVAGMAVGGFADRLFGDGRLVLRYPPTAGAVPAFLADNYRVWRDGIGALDDDGWAKPLGDAWGPYAQESHAGLALHVLDEVVHHAAEIGLLRDLYAQSAFR